MQNIYNADGNRIADNTLPLFDMFSGTVLIRHMAGNSKSAFATAYNLGYRAMEGDVRFTSDSVPIMSHDETMSGLNIANSTLAQLQAVTSVYTFEEWLIDCHKYNILAEIDFTKTYTDSQCASLVTLIKKHGMQARCTIESYYNTSAARLVAQADDLVLSVLQLNSVNDIDQLSSIESKCRKIICVIPHETITRELVIHAHSKGYPVRVWAGNNDTVNDVEGYLDIGVDYVITDNAKPSDIVPS